MSQESPIFSMPCNACNECVVCQIVGSLLVSQTSLQEQLDLTWLQANQDKATIMGSINHCTVLEERVDELEQERNQFETALNEARARQMAIHQNLIEERNKNSITNAALLAENKVLSKIIDDISPIPSITGHPVTVQKLLQSYQKQWKIISSLRTANQHYKLQFQRRDEGKEECDDDENMTEFEDEQTEVKISMGTDNDQ